MESIYNLIVIGAGMAGLSTADIYLQKYPKEKVLVIESSGRVGGRTYSEEIRGETWDLGGQWIGPGQNRMYKMCERFGLVSYEQLYEGDITSILANGEKKRYSGSMCPPHTQQYFKDIERCIDEISISSEKRIEYDSMSVFEWKVRMYGENLAQQLNSTQDLAAVDPREISFLYWLLFIKYGTGLPYLTETHQGGQHARIKGSAHLLSKKLYSELVGRCEFVFGSFAVSISQDSAGVKVLLGNGSIYKAVDCVIAIPPVKAAKIKYYPPLSQGKQFLLWGYRMGAVIKTLVFYENPWWRDQGFSGITITNNSNYGVRLSYDASIGNNYALVAFFLGNSALEWSDKSGEERLKHICDSFAEFFDNRKDPYQVLDYVEKDWTQEPNVEGGYYGYLPPFILTMAGGADVIQKKEGRVHFAGTETATQFMGYIEGAIQSAERVVNEISETSRTVCSKL